MSDMDKLKKTVLEQAHQDGQGQLKVDIKEIDENFEAEKATVLKEKEDERLIQLKALEQRYQVEIQQVKNQGRQRTLSLKQSILSDLFQSALEKMESFDKEQDLSFLYSVLGQYEDQELCLWLGEKTGKKMDQADLSKLCQDFSKLEIASEWLKGEAGFLISIGDIDYSYVYSELIDSIYKEECTLITNAIFNED
ncbi:hypothetical protein [Streptococcus catagoni]|uniref:hypothetical protein n=1 Tax=Streptococcus catagoni TaxID=2654874 RepID=UPI00140C9F88|nr:hypothetical protein [Streptococcus catagoni]